VDVVAVKFLTRIRFNFRDAVWTDADQSGISLYSVKVPDQWEQENFSSIGVGHNKHGYDIRWWNVVADQKAGDVNIAVKCVFTKRQENRFC
jgi:hypothetical protein